VVDWEGRGFIGKAVITARMSRILASSRPELQWESGPNRAVGRNGQVSPVFVSVAWFVAMLHAVVSQAKVSDHGYHSECASAGAASIQWFGRERLSGCDSLLVHSHEAGFGPLVGGVQRKADLVLLLSRPQIVGFFVP